MAGAGRITGFLRKCHRIVERSASRQGADRLQCYPVTSKTYVDPRRDRYQWRRFREYSIRMMKLKGEIVRGLTTN
jgi:hypothetical protein